MKMKVLKVLIVSILSFILVSCVDGGGGGSDGGGSSNPNEITSQKNWDNSNWDELNWQ